MTILEEWRRTSPNFNESHEQWADTVKRFVEKEIAPNIDAWEEAGELPRELHKKAAEVGILGLGFPEEYGGVDEGIDRFHGMVTAHEMAQVGAGGLLAGLMVHAVGLAPVLTLGDAAIKKRIAPDVLSGDKLISLAVTETSGGSDVSQLHTRGELKGDHYVVNGSKTFITGGMRSDYFTVAVRTAGEGPQGISLLLLEADMPGVERTVLKKMGWHCSDTATLYFDNVKVPVENRIGPDGGAFLAMMTNFNGERRFRRCVSRKRSTGRVSARLSARNSSRGRSSSTSSPRCSERFTRAWPGSIGRPWRSTRATTTVASSRCSKCRRRARWSSAPAKPRK
jgi:acyl-CoA dehydrogenase